MKSVRQHKRKKAHEGKKLGIQPDINKYDALEQLKNSDTITINSLDHDTRVLQYLTEEILKNKLLKKDGDLQIFDLNREQFVEMVVAITYKDVRTSRAGITCKQFIVYNGDYAFNKKYDGIFLYSYDFEGESF